MLVKLLHSPSMHYLFFFLFKYLHCSLILSFVFYLLLNFCLLRKIFYFRIFVNDNSNQFMTSYGDSTKMCSAPTNESADFPVSNVRINVLYDLLLY